MLQGYAKLTIVRKLIPQGDQCPLGLVGCNRIRWQCFACNQLLAERDSLSFIGIFCSCAKLFLSETCSKIRLEDSALPHQSNQFTAPKNLASDLMNNRKPG
jgi:phage FluMu protein Com